MLFVKTDTSLQARVISPTKAERVGLYDAKVGETVNMLVDSGNVLMDVSLWPDGSSIRIPFGRHSAFDPRRAGKF
jgi:hypothetical protein